MKTYPHSWPTARPMRGSAVALRQQHGAFLITFALFMLFLLGFMGIALDFGRLFVVKSELQTAMDSCALAAARELNGQDDSIVRARSAGMTAGNSNRADLQSVQGQLTTADISFRDKDYLPSASPKDARYAECADTMSSIKLWLLHAMGAFSGDSATWSKTGTVGARAVATRGSGQGACPMPLGFKITNTTPPDYGRIPTHPYTFNPKLKTVDIDWANLDPESSHDANETRLEVDGRRCDIKVKTGIDIGTPGNEATVVQIWNYRFGIYKGAFDPAHRPDFSGHIYPMDINAFNRYEDFKLQRLNFTRCGANPSDCGMQGGGFSTVATSVQHKDFGADRRIVLVPFVNGAGTVQGFACMLMLQPMKIPVETVLLEYLGNANDPGSPCTTNGLAGGGNGPLVPVLVR